MHIVGAALMAGTTFCQLFLFHQLWKNRKINAVLQLDLIIKLEVVVIAGLIIMLSSGATMLFLVEGVYDQQLWFQVKMIIIGLLIVNGAVIKKKMTKKLRWELEKPEKLTNHPIIPSSRFWLYAMLYFEVLMFVSIFILAIFKFNSL